MINRIRLYSSVAAALMALGTSSTLHAQFTGGGSTGGGSTGGGGGSTGGGSFGGTTGANSIGGGSGGGGGGAGGSGGGGWTGGGGGAGGGAAASSVDQTNFLRSSYSNPLYMGRPNQIASTTPTTGFNSTGSTIGAGTNASQSGGFGQPSFGTSSSSGARTGVGGSATTSTGLGGRTGGATRLSSSTANQSATRISYSATLKFAPQPVMAPVLHSELRGILDRSTTLKFPGRIQLSMEENTVVLKGTVADEDERRLVEGMVRLTPGVRDVRNELQVP